MQRWLQAFLWAISRFCKLRHQFENKNKKENTNKTKPCIHYISSYLYDNYDPPIVDRSKFSFQIFNVFKPSKSIYSTNNFKSY